jgi:endonuclease/exonuclease/phosphatase (EEP) superfamily protein YafD
VLLAAAGLACSRDAGAGLVLARARPHIDRIRVHSETEVRGSALLALWIAFAVMFVEEARSIARLVRSPEAGSREASQQGRAVRVVSLNCHVGNDKAAAEVAACEPDIVLLQESPGREHLARLSRDFFGDDGEFIWGGDTAILARGRLQPRNADGTSHFVHAVVELPNDLKMNVISVRLSPPVFRLDFWRPGFWRDHRDKRVKHRRQIQDVVDDVQSISSATPVIVGGDFNVPPNDGALAALRQRLYDTFQQAGRGWGATGTSRFPLFRVDQIWVSRDLRAESVVTRRTIHSDHRMVKKTTELLNSDTWKQQQCPDVVSLAWEPLLPPEKLLVRWTGYDTMSLEAFLPLNVEDAKQLPPPAELAEMTADDMLLILAASDPSAAFRAWARKQKQEGAFDEELDAAIPPDLDPLRRYELKSTFLRRVRSRARILAQLRHNLQRPVWNIQALQWRLEGFIGIRPLAERLLGEVTETDGSTDEALLTLADLVILLREVAYEPVDGSLSKQEFQKVYEPFLVRLVDELNTQVHGHRDRVGRDLLSFWDRVVQRCRE